MTEWFFRALIASALVTCGAFALDRAFSLVGKPRRLMWAGAMSVSVLLPLAGHWFPATSWTGELLGRLSAAGIGADGSAAYGVDTVAAQGMADAIGWPGSLVAWLDGLILLAWPIASTILASIFVCSYRRVLSDASQWREGIIDGLPVLVSDSVGPALVGIARPRIVVPEWVLDLPAAERRLTMQHEAEHARSGDSRLLAAAGLLLVLMPWNLPLWWQHLRLRLAVETDCDARVLAAGATPREYGRFLLEAATRRSTLPAFGPALSMPASLLERRIAEMTSRLPRHSGMRALLLIPVTVFAAAIACDVTSPSTPQVDATAEHSDQLEGELDRRKVESVAPEPLILVDGVIATRGLEDISPDDVERIEVLKGAAAEALFGDRGSDGVVSVFTKSSSSEVDRGTPEESSYDAIDLVPDAPLPPSGSGLTPKGIRLRAGQPDR